jgi:hypothetical protein
VSDDPDSKNPDFWPGKDIQAAVRRMQLWLEQYPDDVSVASQIGSSQEFVSPGWPYRMYAVDRRDLEAVLKLVQNLPNFQIYTADASTVCEACDTNITWGDQDPRLYSLVEVAAAHVCDPVKKAKISGTA